MRPLRLVVAFLLGALSVAGFALGERWNDPFDNQHRQTIPVIVFQEVVDQSTTFFQCSFAIDELDNLAITDPDGRYLDVVSLGTGMTTVLPDDQGNPAIRCATLALFQVPDRDLYLLVYDSDEVGRIEHDEVPVFDTFDFDKVGLMRRWHDGVPLPVVMLPREDE